MIFRFIISAMIVFLSCSSAQSRNKPAVIKVTTYNVNFFSRGVENVTRTISSINPDVIAMQEVLVSSGTDYSKIIAKRLGYHHASSIPYVQFKDGTQWVLSFLSRYPIVSVRQTRLDRYRRVLKIQIRVNESSVWLANTHLSPMVWTTKNLIGANSVRSQMRKRELTDMLEFIRNDEVPVLLLGDLNAFDNSGIHDEVTSKGYTDADGGLLGNKDTFAIDRSVMAKLKNKLPDFIVPEEITLDYIFTKGNIKTLSTEVTKVNTSDHYPLTGKFVVLDSR